MAMWIGRHRRGPGWVAGLAVEMEVQTQRRLAEKLVEIEVQRQNGIQLQFDGSSHECPEG